MSVKPYLFLSGLMFLIVALMHAWRAVAALPVTVGTTAVPLGLSWVAVVVAGGLGLWGLRLASRS